MKIAAAVLAGGQSRRRGTDKANLPSLDDAETTLLLRTVRLAAVVFEPVFVVGRSRPEAWPQWEHGTIFLPDEESNLGPAGGLATLLRFLTTGPSPDRAAVAVLACDLPLLTSDALIWLARAVEQGMGRHGLVTRNGQQIEPLFAVYTRDCLPLLLDQLTQGKRSLLKLIEAGEFVVVDTPAEISEALVNVNTAEDLAQARSLAPFVKKP
jgi:molybdopterin-guanine dinucleotide biosynthesis protein A